MKRKLKHVQFDTSRHGKKMVYFRRDKGRRIRLPDDVNSKEFQEHYNAALNGIDPPTPLHVKDWKDTPIERRKQRTEKMLVAAVRAARTRANKKNVPFDIDIDFLLDMAAAQDFKCEMTGIEFFHDSDAGSKVAPYIPSIDRIDPCLGYVKGNVRLTCFAINAMMLDWGEDVFVQVANSYRYRKRTKKEQSAPAL